MGDEYLWIIMEYCGGGSVRDLLVANGQPLDESQIAFLCGEALRGLVYLHSIFKIHRDIKCSNILLTEVGRQTSFTLCSNWACVCTVQVV